jgi:CheY-like chemotaxis protein/anti-sigma regulatory factor (Ser/Thr protein kinase)
MNLISNALKFTERGEVVVTVKLAAGTNGAAPADAPPLRISICVADTGIGIAADKIDRLFQPFSQVDSSTARRFGGSGLGLAICKRLVQAMGGDFQVDSEPGVGTRFRFDFATHSAQPVIAAGPAPVSGALQGKRALLVDDNATNLRILGQQVSRWGMRAQAFLDPAQALALLASGERFDLLITDMHMPQMDGMALAQEVHGRWPDLPLVLLCSVLLPRLPAGDLFAAILTKPVREKTLYEALAAALSGPAETPDTVDLAHTQFDPEMAARMPMRILLAEDNPVNRNVALRMLAGFGYDADIALNGVEAVALAQEGHYDLVLMDVQMPLLDGLEATRRIRRLLAPRDQPRIVAVSANAMREDTEAALRAGMDGYVLKPISIPLFKAALEDSGRITAARSIADRALDRAATPDLPAAIAEGDSALTAFLAARLAALHETMGEEGFQTLQADIEQLAKRGRFAAITHLLEKSGRGPATELHAHSAWRD